METQLVIAIDVGGTFTDVVAATPAGRLFLAKVPTTPDPSEGVIDGLRQILGTVGATPDSVKRFIHGTTIATNAVIERAGARVGLLTTKGFEDVLEIGRQKRSELYNLFIDPETPTFLAPRRQRIGVPERVDASGAIVTHLDESAVLDAVRHLREAFGVEAIAVCYLFAFLNPKHERRTKELIEQHFPGMAVSISSEIDPTFREYERTVVTAFDAYVRPKVSSYIARLEQQLQTAGVPARLEVIQSHGGITTARSAVEKPVNLLRSGPAAGVIAGRFVGEATGEKNLITIDIGGTSADIALIVDGKPLTSTDGKIDKYPLRVPMLEVISIGAGGGSIAWLDEAGGLHVGPQSAGAVPGPVCYGRGGERPTVTDASVVLGYLNPEYFAGGTLSLRVDAARDAMTVLGEQLGLSADETAAGIHTILNNRMADEIRRQTVARGYDPRQFTLLVLGGAGALHGWPLARSLGIPRVIVPRTPGVLSAFGLLVANIQHDHALSFRRRLDALDHSELAEAFRHLDRLGLEKLRDDGVPQDQAQVRRTVDMRYLGQSYELEIPVEGPLDATISRRLEEEFHRTHQRVYRQHSPEAVVEIVNLRTSHYSVLPAPDPEPLKPGSSWEAAQTGTRQVYFREKGSHCEVPVFHRERLPIGVRRPGPFIVEQPDTTTMVFPETAAYIDPRGNLIIEREAL